MPSNDTQPDARQIHYDRHYRAGGFGYEEKRDQWTRWVQQHYVEAFELRPAEHPPRLIDVACGNGFWTSVFDGLGLDAQGVDASQGGVEAARAAYPHLTFHVGNAEGELPIDKGSMDVVFVRAITHLHRSELFVEPTLRMVRNLMRYVSPSGQMLHSYYTKRDGGGTPHHHYHPVSDLVKLFETAGDPWRVDVVGDFVQVGVRHRRSDGNV